MLNSFLLTYNLEHKIIMNEYIINLPVCDRQQPEVLKICQGKSYVFVGANGSGKTRLGVFIEQKIPDNVHRIAAHRSLVLNPMIQAIKSDLAQRRFLYGSDSGSKNNKFSHRWRNNPAIILLDDFSHVLTALYSEENKLAIEHRQEHLKNPQAIVPVTKFDILKDVWRDLLPHREIIVYDGDIKVKSPLVSIEEYSASELSDGERVLFYLIGQCLLVNPGCVIIIDEPELHIHKAILQTVWNKLESVRADCSFVYLTHDLEFAASRAGAIKYAVQSFKSNPLGWEIESLSEHENIPEGIITRVLGSRLPILFVEGDESSLDVIIYKRLFTEATVIPVGSCEQVIHSVVTFRNNQALHRCQCCGIVDLDERNNTAIGALNVNNVFVLSVPEIENIIANQGVLVEFCRLMHFSDADISSKIDQVMMKIIELAEKDIDMYCIRCTRRHIDTVAKSISFDSRDISSLDAEVSSKLHTISPIEIYERIRSKIKECIEDNDYERLLSCYDNKGMLGVIGKEFGFAKRKDFVDQFCRFINIEEGEPLRRVFHSLLPMLIF